MFHRIHPPQNSASAPRLSGTETPYKLTINVDVCMPSAIR
jgi:hypothetical protein